MPPKSVYFLCKSPRAIFAKSETHLHADRDCYTSCMRDANSKKHEQLFARRTEIEAHLAALLKQIGSDATVGKFKQFIYEQGSIIPFGDFVTLAFRQFPTL